jgi:hypothetical protein
VLILDPGSADGELSRCFTGELKARLMIRVPNNAYPQMSHHAGRFSKPGRTGQSEATSYHRTKPARLNSRCSGARHDYGKHDLVYLVTDLPAKQARERYRMRTRIEQDPRDLKDLKSTLGLKHLRPRKHIDRRVAPLPPVATVTASAPPSPHPRAVAGQAPLDRRRPHVSPVRLAAMVYRPRCSRHVGGIGSESSPALTAEQPSRQ